jgi:hypothetical protein
MDFFEHVLRSSPANDASMIYQRGGKREGRVSGDQALMDGSPLCCLTIAGARDHPRGGKVAKSGAPTEAVGRMLAKVWAISYFVPVGV